MPSPEFEELRERERERERARQMAICRVLGVPAEFLGVNRGNWDGERVRQMMAHIFCTDPKHLEVGPRDADGGYTVSWIGDTEVGSFTDRTAVEVEGSEFEPLENRARRQAYVLLALHQTPRLFGTEPGAGEMYQAARRLRVCAEFLRSEAQLYSMPDQGVAMGRAMECEDIAGHIDALAKMVGAHVRNNLRDELRGEIVKNSKTLMGNLSPFFLSWLTGLDAVLGLGGLVDP